jgi:hypothetical protein
MMMEPDEPTEEEAIDGEEAAFWARLRPSSSTLVVFAKLQLFPGWCMTSAVMNRLMSPAGGDACALTLAVAIHGVVFTVLIVLAGQASEREVAAKEAERRAADENAPE